MDNTSQSGPPERSHGGSGAHLNGAGLRRPQTLMSPVGVDRKLMLSPPTQNLTLTIHKDCSGYGMKVSGDNPVYVESVKTGGAAQKAGLLEGDMILKVNGTAVRFSTHTNVVQLIKASPTVELTVQRAYKMQRSSSVSVGPSTPIAQRGNITAPLPVDLAKRREMEYSKMSTLRLMMEQEKKNLENLKSSSNSNRNDVVRAEGNILKLGEQIKQMCGEDPTLHLFTPIQTPTIIQPHATTPSSTPAFLSRFPRSLSSLSLGGKKKSSDKDLNVTSPNTSGNAEMLSPPQSSSGHYIHHHQHAGHHHHPHHHSISIASVKNKFSGSTKDLKNSGDQPPPLPQRNFPRKTQPSPITTTSPLDGVDGEVVLRRNTQISDLDHSFTASNNNISHSNSSANDNVKTKSSSGGKGKKRNKAKIKANSDPKISTQLFIQMEKAQSIDYDNQQIIVETGHSVGNEPPPLPPRQPGMLEENQNLLNNSKLSNSSSAGSRPAPNSLDTLLNYPLIATCTAVRDNISAFPLSHRPNIVQQLQQNNNNNNNTVHQHYLQSSSSSTVSKSTAFCLTPHQMGQKSNSSSHRRVVSSPEQHLHARDSETFVDRPHKSASGIWEHPSEKDGEITPPGTPPPPYKANKHQTKHQPLDESGLNESLFDTSTSTNTSFSGNISAAQSNIVQRQIISMEDDEIVDDQDSISEDHGPFRSLQQLIEHENLPHLAVFLNFVLSNSNPSPLLFYLITGLYKEGSVKDMRKWAYEIHSTFLVPRAPLLWGGVDESLAREVDDVLQNEYDKGEILRKIFWKSRVRAKEHITQQLDDFQIKRTAGLGTMYGPTDQQLSDAKGDKVKEQRIFEEYLIPKLQQLVDELDKEMPNECPKNSALCSALSTVLHRIFLTRSNPGGPIERVNHFVSREKSFKSRLIGKNRKIQVRGHHLILKQYYEVAHCNHCQNIIWGVSPQGYHCTDCELNIHRACSRVLEENCPGPAPTKRKEPHNDTKMSKFMEKIRPTHYFIQAERSRRQDDECGAEDLFSVDRPTSTSVVRQPSDRRPDLNSNTSTTHGHNSNELTTSHSVDTDTCAQDAELENRDSSKSKSAPVSVNRSESYKERLSHKRNRNNRRKTSDPSLSKTNGEQQVELGINNFTASSSSSLSSSLDSPSTSLEAVGAPAGQGTAPAPRQWVDSEDEAGDLEADWSSNVSVEILQTLSDAEKKRQEVINEIYQTEKNHVRTLRLLEGIFMRPLQESGTLPPDHLTLLFPPSLLVLKDIHSSFEQQLKLRRSDHGPLIGDIGDLLLAMFDGRTGDDLREHAAQFCARQQIALEALKEKRRKDEHLQRLLTKAESHKACRRLQLKDLLPTALQRLTKYPLLFESLLKITKRVAPENEIEAQAILCAVESSRRILDHVNQAVRIAEDAHKLQTIQKRLDKSSYEKEASSEFKNLDLTQHKLIYDGPLIMKKNPGVQLHGLLFETMMVLLIKQDDKYILKFQSSPGLGSGESKSIEGRFNPITKINLIFVRQSAVEKNTFFLINTNVSQMLELTAPSSSECKTWFKHISEAAEAYKGRTKGNHDAVPLDDPASVTLSSSSTKESLEGTPEKDLVSGTGASATTGPLNDNQLNNNNLEIQKENAGHHHSNRGDINESNLDNRSGHNGYRNGDSKTGTNDDEGPSRGGSKYRPGDFSNNSNNTRTLTQQSSLVAPTEVHISVSPALTAEPVLTPNERLRRLDESIRLTLVEKQKIVCDMFKVPVEHFSAIADIAGQPEAPKEPSDIVLAAFAQVQSLTETLNDYISISQTQEISAVSTSLCDDCHNKAKQIRDQSPGQLQNQTQQLEVAGSVTDHSSNSSNSSTVITVVRNPSIASDRNDIIADDDGYCEIDEIRLPSIVKSTASPTSVSSASPISMNTNTTASVTVSSSSSSLVSTAPTSISSINITQTVITPDLKRQSTISADSIPEECEHEIGGDNQQATKIAAGTTTTSDHQIGNGDSGEDEASAVASKILDDNDAGDVSTSDVPTASISGTNASNDADEHIEVNDAYDSISQQMSEFNLDSGSITEPKFCCSETCRANRLIHAQSIAPAVPCHLISTYVAQLNSQISQLLPKLNERDIEREKLRKENQHLRDLLNSMHERELVSNDKETPGNGTSSTQESTN